MSKPEEVRPGTIISNVEQAAESSPEPRATPLPTAASVPQTGPMSQAAALLMGVKLPIRVLLGRTQLCLRDVAQLGSGSIVELDCSPNDPVEIIVNGRVIAHGEVVVVAGNYGVRITSIPNRDEKIAPVEGTDLINLSERLK